MDSVETTPERKDVWRRGLFMLVFVVLFGIGHALLKLLAVAQFLWLLFTGRPNQILVDFGRSLAEWLAQVGRFQCCETEDKPFPWKAWPTPE
ncbi:MAG: DUF4389 domain-containing protein [Hyphomicrobiales bacterium]|nr:DUF4389 domain-containing protein [Hyphomicrobiales bacterium]